MNATRTLALVLALCGAALLVHLASRGGPAAPPEAVEGGSSITPDPGPEPARGSLPAGQALAAEPGPAAAETDSGAARAAADPRRALAPTAAEQRREPRWTGRVLDEFGLSVADAQVSIGPAPSTMGSAVLLAPRRVDASGTTDDAGRFALTVGRKRDDPWVEVRARGFRLFAQRVEVSDGTRAGDRELGDLSLVPGAVLVGRVLDDAGVPVAGARVEPALERGAMQELIEGAIAAQTGVEPQADGVLTDEQGVFELGNEEPGAFAYVVRHELHPPARIEGELEVGQTLSLEVRLERGARITGLLRGYPADARGVRLIARPLDAVAADEPPAEEAEAVLESDGRFEVSGLHAGLRYELFATRAQGFALVERCSDRVEADAGEEGVQLEYDAGASVVFQLVDAESGAAVAEADVRYSWIGEDGARAAMMAMGGAERPSVDSDGTVTIRELRPVTDPGRLRVVVRASGYREHEIEEVALAPSARVDLGAVALRSAGVVRVQVVDSRSGDPVSGARVRLAEDRLDLLSAAMQAQRGGGEDSFDPDDFDMLRPPRVEKGRTDAEGLCELPGFHAAAVVLEVKSRSHSDYRREDIVLLAGGVHTEHVVLRAGATVEVRVVDVFDQPAAKVRVEHREPGDPQTARTHTRNTNAKGIARFARLSAGSHAFRVSPQGEADVAAAMRAALGEEQPDEVAWSEVGVRDGSEHTVVLSLPTRSRLEGRVTAGARPLASATVRLRPVRAGDDVVASRRELQLEMMGGGARWSGSTDDDGRYLLEDLPPGSFELIVFHDERPLDHRVEVELSEGYNERDVALHSTTVEGRVIDPSGAPVSGARVIAVRASEAGGEIAEVREFLRDSGLGRGAPEVDVRTGSLGEFRLRDLPVGPELVLRASHEDFAPASSASFELAPDELRSGVDVTLGAAGRIRVSAPGRAGPFVFVSAERDVQDGELKSAARSRNAMVRQGRALLTGLAPGTWRVELGDASGAGSAEQVVQVRAGEETAVLFED